LGPHGSRAEFKPITKKLSVTLTFPDWRRVRFVRQKSRAITEWEKSVMAQVLPSHANRSCAFAFAVWQHNKQNLQGNMTPAETGLYLHWLKATESNQ